MNDSLSQDNLVYPDGEFSRIESRGWMFISNDGIGNPRSGISSPFSERFPVVQGIEIIGNGVPSTPLGWQDVLNFQQLDEPFIAGTEISCVDCDGLALQVTVEPGTGLAVWCCLMKQLNLLRMFVFTIREGQFILDDASKAFVCELDENYRELAR